MSKKRKTYHGILIICEGENTEPLYFDSIKSLIDEKEIWVEGVSITIMPKPKVYSSKPVNNSRRKRNLRAAKGTIRPSIPKEYSAEPLRFVKEAEIEMESGAYNEAWVIFDDDTRKVENIKKAFELANDNGSINIAYSSISFEYWYLLHFEKIRKMFLKSECREHVTILNCNSGEHKNDCYGDKCVGGYLRSKEYITESTKRSGFSFFEELFSRLEKAYINASWLRYIGNNEKLVNPYTDVDVLVKYLLKSDKNYYWHRKGDNISTGNVNLIIDVIENKVSINNISCKTVIINSEDCNMLDSEFNIISSIDRVVIQPKSNTIVDISLEEVQYIMYVSDESSFVIDMS